MLLFMKPITTKNRRKVGTIERLTKATIKRVRSREPIILLRLSKMSFTKFLRIRKTRRIRRIIFILIRPKTITFVAAGRLVLILEIWLSIYVTTNIATATATTIYHSRFRLLCSSVDMVVGFVDSVIVSGKVSSMQKAVGSYHFLPTVYCLLLTVLQIPSHTKRFHNSRKIQKIAYNLTGRADSRHQVSLLF